ncbi:PLP-dependent aspartate aminotransferase family protein [Acidiferrobacter sp.]|jgi:cystathionine beta-lyase/cystathionine gamma-synthase|uniref:trans-sulfuration enzyme family protein n=1 Tax=Acidiferrobacter sp. TaxID=1872107 RepID=UPI00262E721F|nr:PLP-dependent aspartate aminotransferase family protein [Acidiferrobacter sp.]
MEEERGLSTLCVHGGELKDAHGAPHTPLYDTTTFAFDSTADLLDVVEGRKSGALYTRYGLNPTIQSLEAKLALLEGAPSALAFGSGMAATAALFLAHGREGIVCIGDAYGGTLDLLQNQLPLLGIPTQLLLTREAERLGVLLGGSKKLVFFETPTNPALEIIDIRRMATLAHEFGALVAVDSTFASPVNQRPLAWGADIVVHSATKYLGGHSDLTAGALMGSEALLAPIRAWRSNLGQTIAAETAQLLARSLRTLVVRVERHNENAQAVARALRGHERVKTVFYPGLEDHPGHEIACRQMQGFGGMVTIDVQGDAAEATRIVDRLQWIKIAPSLGGVESLVTQPMTTTHHGLSVAERARRGITDTMIRLSIGLEDPDDLVSDLRQALR